MILKIIRVQKNKSETTSNKVALKKFWLKIKLMFYFAFKIEYNNTYINYLYKSYLNQIIYLSLI